MSITSNFQSVAVNQQPASGTNYPFLYPSSDVQYLLGDLWLAYEAQDVEFTPPFGIVFMYGFGTTPNSNPGPHFFGSGFFGEQFFGSSGFFKSGTYSPTHSQDMVVVDRHGNVVFDSTQAETFTATAWGLNLVTLCWTGTQGVLRATRHTARPAWAPVLTQYVYINPLIGVLDARTYERLPRRVRSIKVGLQTFTDCNVVLSEGYNLNLTPTAAVASASGGRLVSQITVRAKPGDGIGTPSGCNPTATTIKRINSTAPDSNGDFKIDAGECYRLQRSLALLSTTPRRFNYNYRSDTPEAIAAANLINDLDYDIFSANRAAAQAVLMLTNDCGPCCECSDFVNTYKGLSSLNSMYYALGKIAETTRDTHKANIERWTTQIACRTGTNIILLTQPEPGCVMFIAGSVVNLSGGCIQSMTVTISMADTDLDAADIVCRECYRSGTDTNYIEVPFTPIGSPPTVSIFYANADINSVSKFRFRIRYDNCDSETEGTAAVTMTVNFSVRDKVTGVITTPAPLVTTQTVPISKTQGCGDC